MNPPTNQNQGPTIAKILAEHRVQSVDAAVIIHRGAMIGDEEHTNSIGIPMHSNLSCNYLLWQPMTSQGWLLYTYSIDISAMPQFQSLGFNFHMESETL